MDDPSLTNKDLEEAQEAELSRNNPTRMAAVVMMNGHGGSGSSGSSTVQVVVATSGSHSANQEQEEQQQQQSMTTTTTQEVDDAAAAAAMRLSVTMEEVGYLMREQDADLLESHHARGANETNTVLLPPPPPPPPPPVAAIGGGGGGATATTTSYNHMEQQVPLVRQLSLDSSRPIIQGSSSAAAAIPATPTTPTVRKRITLHRSNSRATSEGSVQQQQHDASSGINSTQQQQQMMIEAQFAHLQQQQQPLSPIKHQRRPTLSGQVFEQQNDGTVSTAASSVAAAAAAADSSSAVVSTTATTAVTVVTDVSTSSGGGGGGGDVFMDPHNNIIQHYYGGDNDGDAGSVALSLENMSINNKKPFARTESMERRLNEMAQFAEAVGDVPSTVELRINDDEDHDDDDDSTEAAATSTIAAKTKVTTTTTTTTATSTAAGAAAGTTTAAVESSHSKKRVTLVVPAAAAAAGSSSNSLMRERRDSSDQAVAPPHHHLRVQHSSDSGVVVGGVVTIPVILEGGPTTTTTTTTATTRPKIRPNWPFRSHRGFLDQLPDSNKQQSFTYKGIHANPPDIVKSGSQRGNYAQLHRKAWLEVSDKYHRYGKNLRLYYRYWERLGFPTNSFFDWLDSKGEAAGQPLPELEDCQRSTLDADTVLYITNPDISQRYAVSFHPDPLTGRGLVADVDGEIVATGPDGWIFVLRDNVVYGAPKITSATPGHLSKQRFHHSSFFGGKAVAAAGIFITDDEGYLTRLYPHSGHYRPGEAHIQRMLFYMHQTGVDLRTFEMDMQQILHVARDKDKNKENADAGEKKKKVESLYLMPAVIVACYLAHKARFIGQGIFTQIHRIARTEATNVTEALEAIDGDGLCSSDMAPWLMDQG